MSLHSRFLHSYGPVAVVTGASDGIGKKVFAQSLAARGLNLVVVARRSAALDALSTDLKLAYGITCLPVAADLATATGIDAVLDATSALDVGLLVAAAGFGTSGPFIESELAPELEMIDVNCRAVAALTHEMGRRMARRGRGGIVLLSSLVAFQGVPRAANYAATKAYVQVLAEGLRHELRKAGVDVIASAPGPVASGFGQRAGMTMSNAGRPEDVAEETLRKLGRRGTVRPGLLSKVLEASLSPLPRSGRTMILKRVMAGMTSGGKPT